MKLFHSRLLALFIAAIGSPTWAAQQDQHNGLYPACAHEVTESLP